MDSDNFAIAEEAPELKRSTPFPFSYDDDEAGEKFEICCVCHENSTESTLIECPKCSYWFHEKCIYIPRGEFGEKMQFNCPYCLQQKLRCSCGENNKYNIEMVKCTKCHFYVHKACEIHHPIDIKTFICSHCRSQIIEDNDDGMII